MSSTRERDIIRAFVDLSNELVDGYDTVELLTRLTTSCADLLDLVSAGLLLADGRGVLHLVAASSERTHHLEVFQLQREEGPCLDCFHSGQAVIVPDLGQEAQRWPQFSSAARANGFASVHALPMRLRDTVLGTLGLFGDRVGRLDDDDLGLAQALVHVASVAIVNEKAATDNAIVNAQLQHALDSRIILEQAKGVLAHAGDLTTDEAFIVLRRYARDRGLKLSELAGHVVGRRVHADVLLQHARSIDVLR